MKEQTHVFKVSKVASVQELLDAAIHYTCEQYPFIQLGETAEDVVEGNGLITVKARGLQVIDLTKGKSYIEESGEFTPEQIEYIKSLRK